MSIKFIDSKEALHVMLDCLLQEQTTAQDAWHLSVDFEGINLSRNGEICIGQFAGKGSRVVYVVDVVTMDPFTVDPRLKELLESERVLKLLFDPRCDADALAHLYKVTLKNVLCLQLVDDVIQRTQDKWNRNRVRGFKTVMADPGTLPRMDQSDRNTMTSVKSEGKQFFTRSFEVFKERPLRATVLMYCALDVYFLDELMAAWYGGLDSHWKREVEKCSMERIGVWEEPGFTISGYGMDLSPLKKPKQ